MTLKNLKYLFLFLIITLSAIQFWANWFFFWLKSADNTIYNIQQIESKYKLHIPIVAFIFDPRWPDAINTINNLTQELGTDRIYHITVSPWNMSAKDVANGKFDTWYNTFFKLVKDNNLRVIFRTMHEMNWGRYPRWSDPVNFKKARIHVRKLSREIWLETQNILFDRSVNHRDMPTNEIPSQTARLIPCQPRNKEIRNCNTFEDYYPWHKYVDIVWFSFYNRGKASYNRHRLSPNQILNQKWRDTLARLKKIWKPLFIDEVATTAVRYTWSFDSKSSRAKYLTDFEAKNQRLLQLRNFINKEKSIIWVIYFNVDYTNWLTQKLIGEADWSAININNNKVYTWIFELYKLTDRPQRPNALMSLFNIKLLNISGHKLFVKSSYVSPIKNIIKIISTEKGDKSNILDRLNLKYLYKRFSDYELNEIKELTKEIIKQIK